MALEVELLIVMVIFCELNVVIDVGVSYKLIVLPWLDIVMEIGLLRQLKYYVSVGAFSV